MLDLDGDGVETTAAGDGAFFDYDGNGFAEQTGWVGADDGLLVRDINGDGIINDGSELFGNNTLLQNGQTAADGFAALADLDGNADGKIDANDAVFSQLKIWQDFDGDGLSTEDEFFTLSELGITAINTGYTTSTYVDPNGNEHRQVGGFTWADGTTGNIADVWFQTGTTYSIATEWLDVSPEIAALPDLQGYGTVYDLQQAMVRDTSLQLKGLVESFIAATDPAIRNSLMEQVLFKWTGVEGIDPGSRGVNIDARKLAVLEKLYGEAFVGVDGSNPNTAAAPLLNQSYAGLYEMFYAQMMAQTHLQDLYGMITYTWDDVTQTTRGDLTAVIANLETQLAGDPVAGQQAAREFFRTLQGFDSVGTMNAQAFSSSPLMQVDEFRWVIESAGKTLITGSQVANTISGAAGADAVSGYEGNDTLYGYAGDDVLSGGAGADYAAGGDGNDTLLGGSGDDSLYGENNDDVLDGGLGNDWLNGGTGNDRYLFALGSGADGVYDDGGMDAVEFASGIAVSDLRLSKEGDNLRISINGTTDSLTISNWFSSTSPQFKYRLEEFRFADGTVFTPEQVEALGITIYGTSGADMLFASQVTMTNDQMFGYEGDDKLYGYGGNDVIDGGPGADTLQGGDGNDILDGGSGNDNLSGGYGNDRYLFGLGSGQDTVYDLGTGVVEFGPGIGQSDLAMTLVDASLRFDIKNTSDSLTLADVYSGYGNGVVSEFRFADGSVMDSAQIEAFPINLVGTSGNDSMLGNYGDDHLEGMAGDDYLNGNIGNDTLDGGPGNDTLLGAEGNDRYLFRSGDGADYLFDQSGADTLELGPGIAVSDLLLAPEGSYDLRLSVSGTADTILVASWFHTGGDYKLEQFVFADGATRSLVPTEGADLLVGSTGNDVLASLGGNDTLSGFAGGDALYGESGDDILDGGAGADGLYGGEGNDTYIFGRGNYQDTVVESGTAAGGVDTVRLGSDIQTSDVSLDRDNSNVYLNINGTTDRLTIQNFWDPSGNFRVEYIEFADGTVWDTNSVQYHIVGTAGDDQIYGYDSADVISGLDGNDFLYGGAGNDLMDGGAGDDFMEDGPGQDTYLFGRGSGMDSIYDYDPTPGSVDTIRMGEGVLPSDIIVERDITDVYLSIAGTTDQLDIWDWYYMDEFSRIERIEFADGTVWDSSTIDAMLQTAPTEGADLLYGSAGDDVIDGLGGDDEIYGLERNDTLLGGPGNDLIDGGDGNDLLDGGAGADSLSGGVGDDTYVVDNAGDVVTEYLDEGVDTVQSAITYTLGGEVENLALTGTSAINGTGNSLDNLLTGNGANNTLTGAAGNDTLNGGSGSDTMRGGTGNDTYVVAQTGDVVTENANEGTDTVQSSITYTLGSNVENLTLTGTAAINGTGNSLNNTITGNGGNNTLSGGTGTDTMVGGAGNDIYVVAQSGDVVTENANEGTDTVQSSITYTLGSNVENLTLTGTSAINGTGNSLDNLLTGNGANNTLTGAAGNDTLNGGSGSDTMRGGTGNDTYVVAQTGDVVTENANEGTDTVQSSITYTLGSNVENLTLTGSLNRNGTGNALDNILTGNSGINTLTGNAGNDTLDGGAGNDALVGGTGNDTYLFGTGYGTDTVQENDSTGGNSDTVELGVNPIDVVFAQTANNLDLTIHGSADKLTLQSWYSGNAYQAEVFTAADGRHLVNTQVAQLIQAMATFVTDNGLANWDQAIQTRPQDVQGILAQYWAA